MINFWRSLIFLCFLLDFVIPTIATHSTHQPNIRMISLSVPPYCSLFSLASPIMDTALFLQLPLLLLICHCRCLWLDEAYTFLWVCLPHPRVAFTSPSFLLVYLCHSSSYHLPGFSFLFSNSISVPIPFPEVLSCFSQDQPLFCPQLQP